LTHFPSVFYAPDWWIFTELCTSEVVTTNSQLVLPIRNKISKLGFRVPERKNGKTRGFSWFEKIVILNDIKPKPTLN